MNKKDREQLALAQEQGYLNEVAGCTTEVWGAYLRYCHEQGMPAIRIYYGWRTERVIEVCDEPLIQWALRKTVGGPIHLQLAATPELAARCEALTNFPHRVWHRADNEFPFYMSGLRAEDAYVIAREMVAIWHDAKPSVLKRVEDVIAAERKRHPKQESELHNG